MIITFYSRYSINRIVIIFQWVISFCLLITFLFFCTILFQTKPSYPSLTETKTETPVNFQRILSGPLDLQQQKTSILGLALEQKLKFLGQSERPDIQNKEKVICLAVDGSQECRIIKEEEPIYLKVIQHANGGLEKITFSEEVTEKWIIPSQCKESSLILKVLEQSKESSELSIPISSEMTNDAKLDPKIEDLQKATWWGVDQLFQKYGAVEYSRLGQKQKLEIGNNDDRYILFVGLNDFLSFIDGQWKVLPSLEHAEKKAPLAQIISIQPNQIEIKAWDTLGFFLFHSKHPLEKKILPKISIEQLITEAKLRSAKQISCKIEKKRTLLRPGDWLLKTHSSWHKLVTFSEIDSYLSGKLLGELLVIDEIETSGNVKGHYFDTMRTHMQPFAIRAASSKRKSIQKKNTLSKR